MIYWIRCLVLVLDSGVGARPGAASGRHLEYIALLDYRYGWSCTRVCMHIGLGSGAGMRPVFCVRKSDKITDTKFEFISRVYHKADK